MTRTNIDLNDSLVEAIMRRYFLTTKTEAVDLALRHLAGQPFTIEEILQRHGAGLVAALPQDSAP